MVSRSSLFELVPTDLELEHEAELLHLREALTSSGTLSEFEMEKLKTLESEEHSKKGVELGKYMEYVKGEVDREAACMELPMTIVLLISFSCLAILHLKQDKVFAVEGALRFDIEENANFAWSHNFGHKTIFDVNSIADFWSWLHLGFLPLVVQHSWGFSEGLQSAYTSLNKSHPFSTGDLPGSFDWPMPGEDSKLSVPVNTSIPIRDDYLHYNRIIGGIRIRQERAESSYDLCRFPTAVPEELWKKWLGKPCMPSTPKYQVTPENADAEGGFEEPKRVEWLVTAQDSLQQLQHMVVDMEDGCQQLQEKGRFNNTCLCTTCSDGNFTGPWLDERTQRIEIGFVTYNAEYGLLSLTTVNLFFSRGGMIYKYVHVQSSWADHFAGAFFDVVPMLICDVTWVTLLAYIFVSEVREIYRIIRTSKDRFWRALRDDYLDHWNVVDWISMFLAFFCMQMFLQIFVETGKVIPEFERIARLDVATVNRDEFVEMSQQFMTAMESLCAVERWYRTSFCFYPFAVMLRLFKSFAAQGRLAVVTRTLADAANDMIHFFIVFFSVYFCMTVNAVLIFGQDIEDYCDIGRATMTVFRGMFGDWDWSAMDEGTLWVSAAWFWAFVLVMMVILLNFLLAILMDSYAKVKEESMSEEPLMKQIDTMMRRRSQNKSKERVKLGFIFDTYTGRAGGDEKALLADTRFVTPEDVMKEVDGIPRSQAQRTIKGARDKFALPQAEYGVETVKKDLDLLDVRGRDVRNRVQLIREKVVFHENSIDFDKKATDEELVMTASSGDQILDAVHNEIAQLGINISGVLVDEVAIFADQHKQLDAHTRNTVSQVQETRREVETIQAAFEATKILTQRHAIFQQRQRAQQKADALAKKDGGVCGSSAPVPRRSLYGSSYNGY